MIIYTYISWPVMTQLITSLGLEWYRRWLAGKAKGNVIPQTGMPIPGNYLMVTKISLICNRLVQKNWMQVTASASQ